MNITEAFKKSDFITADNFNGILTWTGSDNDYGQYFTRIHINEVHCIYETNRHALTIDDIMHENWKPVNLKVSITKDD